MSSKQGRKKDADDLISEVSTAITHHESLFSGLTAGSAESRSALPKSTEPLLLLEKRCRLSGDFPSAVRLARCVLTLCWHARDVDRLAEVTSLLCKRRGQHKSVVIAAVEVVTGCIAEIDGSSDSSDSSSSSGNAMDIDGEKKVALEAGSEAFKGKETLIGTLREVTEGKIYCEVERARLTKELSRMKELAGDIKGAADVIQEVQVETYGAMERREKAEFLLEQIRLCLDTEDFVRTELITNKMTAKVLDEEMFQDIRVKYYELMIRFHLHKRNHLSVSKDYFAIYRTGSVQEDDAQWKRALKRAVVHAVLAPFDKDQQELIHMLAGEKRIEQLAEYRALASTFTKEEVARWSEVRVMFEKILPVDHPDLFNSGTAEGGAESAEANWEAFHSSVVRHTIRVVSNFYDRITTARLASLLDLSTAETEKHIADMVVGGKIYARIDRPAGIVSFVEPRGATGKLNDWASDIAKLLSYVDRTCHLISMDVQNHETKK